jgi:hypothetical protein
MSRGRLAAFAALLLTAHAGASIWIAASYRRSDNPWLLLAVSALPLAQTSLLAMWAAWGRGPSHLRTAVVVIAVTELWAVECHSLNLNVPDDRCAAYALTFAVQTVLISGLLAAMRPGGWLIGRRGPDRGKPERRVQFGVGFVLGWVTAVAVVLGVWKLVLIHSGWPVEVLKGTFFLFGGTVGAYNAVFALLVLAGVWWGRRWYRVLAQAVLALVLVCAVALSQSVVLRTLFGTNGRVETAAWVVQAGFQALYLLVTLVPIRLCGYHQLKESTHGTSSCLAARCAGLPDPA